MKKLSIIVPALIMASLLNGCGNNNSGTSATTTYDTLPASVVTSNPNMGGTTQGVALAAPTTVDKLAGTPPTTDSSGKTTYGFGYINTSSTTEAKFNRPSDITTDGTYLYVADYDNHAIRKIDPSVNPAAVSTVAGTGLAGSADGTGTSASFNHPSGITTDGTNLYVADTGSHTIRQVVISSGVVTTIAGIAGTSGSIDATTGTQAKFSSPIGITTDGTSLFVTDSGNQTIRRIALAGLHAVTTVAGSAGSAGSADGVQGAARFNLPARITTTGSKLFVTDFYNRTIRRIDLASGNVTTLAGQANTAPGTTDADAVGTAARFYQPNGITTDGTYLYVSDSYNNTIRRVEIATGAVTKIAGTTYVEGAAQGYFDGPVLTAKLYAPIGMTIKGGSLLVADNQNHVIRKLN